MTEERFKEYSSRFANSKLVGNIIYQDQNIYDSINNRSVLIIGGGPSTNESDWIPHGYDTILSCNHFFLNEAIANINVNIATISPEMNVKSQDFLDYVNHHNTIFVYDNEWWDSQGARINQLHTFCGKKFSNIRFRYHSKLGAGARLLVLACELGAESISIIGIDGYPPGIRFGHDSKHSFESGKKITTSYSYDVFDKQYKQLAEYVKTFNIPINNLGKGHPYNILTKYI